MLTDRTDFLLLSTFHRKEFQAVFQLDGLVDQKYLKVSY